MAEISEDGYEDIRDHIESTWVYLELRDDADSQIIRVDDSDSRLSWTHSDGDQTLEYTITVSGSDSDISPPQTFEKSALYKEDSGGDYMSLESFTQFTIETSDDQLTVKHQVQVPQV